MRLLRMGIVGCAATWLTWGASLASAGYIDTLNTVAGSDRISLWSLEETSGITANDSWSGGTLDGGNNGTYSDIGAGVTLGVAGPRASGGFAGFGATNNAVQFNGTAAQLLQMADSASYAGLQALTLTMWFNIPNGQAGQRYFGGLADKTVGASGRYGFGFNSNTNVRGFVRLQDGATELTSDSGTGGVTPNFRDGNWHFLALTMADSGADKQFQIYVDTNLKFTGTVVGGAGRGLANRVTSDATGALTFGAELGDTTRSFIGKLDEIAFIGRALTGAELTTVYQAAVVPEPSSIVITVCGMMAMAAVGFRRRAT